MDAGMADGLLRTPDCQIEEPADRDGSQGGKAESELFAATFRSKPKRLADVEKASRLTDFSSSFA
jgi:hypothetical protein